MAEEGETIATTAAATAGRNNNDDDSNQASPGGDAAAARDHGSSMDAGQTNGNTSGMASDDGSGRVVMRPAPITTRSDSVHTFMDFAPTPKNVGGHRSRQQPSESAMKLNLQPLQLDQPSDDDDDDDDAFQPAGSGGWRGDTRRRITGRRSSADNQHHGDSIIGRRSRLVRTTSAPVVMGRGTGHATPPSDIVRHLSKSRQAQRRKMMLRARDATPAAREGCVESGTIPQVYQELLDIFWPSRLRQQLLSASPLSCSYGDMAQAWGYTPKDNDLDADDADGAAAAAAVEGGAGTGGQRQGDAAAAAAVGAGSAESPTQAGQSGSNNNSSSSASTSDWSPISGTILFPAHRTYLTFRFELVIAAVLKKHQTFSQVRRLAGGLGCVEEVLAAACIHRDASWDNNASRSMN